MSPDDEPCLQVSKSDEESLLAELEKVRSPFIELDCP